MRDSVEMPTGTVTFLFSDIEGSTRLVQTLGDDYPELLDQPSVCCEGLSQKVEVSSAALI